MPELKSKPNKTHGLAHLFAATRYSLAGGRYLLRETAARHELIMILAAFIGFFLMDVAAHHYVVLAAISLLIMSIEAVNSACELIVDHLSPDYSQFAKHAKDLLSFAVFCILLMFGVYVTYVAGIWFAS